MAIKQYLDYEGLQELVLKINEKFAPIQAIQYKGSVATVSALPTVATVAKGSMYNIEAAGITTADFTDGAGFDLVAGTNVVAVNVGTDAIPSMKWDVIAGVFELDDRLQFGFEMPASPVNNQIFLYMGETSYIYSVTAVEETDNPAELGLYEYDSINEVYSLTADLTPEIGKTYFTRAEDKLKGTIYKYVADEWVAQTQGHEYVPITIAAIDALFD